jgi:hypothetical protein
MSGRGIVSTLLGGDRPVSIIHAKSHQVCFGATGIINWLRQDIMQNLRKTGALPAPSRLAAPEASVGALIALFNGAPDVR